MEGTYPTLLSPRDPPIPSTTIQVYDLEHQVGTQYSSSKPSILTWESELGNKHSI